MFLGILYTWELEILIAPDKTKITMHVLILWYVLQFVPTIAEAH